MKFVDNLKIKIYTFFLIWALATPQIARAISFSPSTFSSGTNTIFEDLVSFVGLGADVHAYESAIPRSTNTGADIAISATAIAIPGKVTNGLTTLGIPNIPHFIPIPKINLQKGIAERIILGTEFLPNISIQGNKLSLYGFDAQYAFIKRPHMPVFTFRAQFNYADFVFVRALTYGGDLIIGHRILFLDIYGGGGYRFVTGEVSNPTATIPSLPGVALSHTIDAGHFLVGLSSKISLIKVTLEANLTTRGINTYGTNIGIVF